MSCQNICIVQDFQLISKVLDAF